MIKRNPLESRPSTYCDHCHQPLTREIETLHASYCSLSTPKCLYCDSNPNKCLYCKQPVPICQQASHLTHCQAASKPLRKRLNIFLTSCPYCKRQTNLDQVLRHLDVCPAKRGRKSGRQGEERIGKIFSPRCRGEREQETSIEKQRELLSYRVDTTLINNRLESDNNRLESDGNLVEKRGRRVETETGIRVEEVTTKNDERLQQMRYMTPVPLFIKVENSTPAYFKKIKRVGFERENVGKVSRNY